MDTSMHRITGWLERYAEYLMIAVCVLAALVLMAFSLLRHDALRTVLPDVFLTHGMPLPLVLPGMSIAIASWLLFRLTRTLTNSGLLGFVLGLSLLLVPAIPAATIGTVSPFALGVPLLLGAVWSAQSRHFLPYWICIALLLVLHEGMTLIVLALSPLISLRSGLHGTLTFCAAVAYGGLLFMFAGTQGVPLGASVLANYAYLGDSIEEVAAMIFGEPTVSWPLLVEVGRSNLSLLPELAWQGMWLALLAPAALLPALLIASLRLIAETSQPMPADLSLFLAGSILLACAYAIARLHRYVPRLAFVIAAILLIQIAFAGFTTWHVDVSAMHDPEAWQHIRSLVPRKATLATQDNLAAHFAGRNALYSLEHAEEADFILLFSAVPTEDAARLFGMPPRTFSSRTRELLRHPRFGVVDHASSFILLERGASRTENDRALEELEEGLGGRW